jgi:hypothetical protein
MVDSKKPILFIKSDISRGYDAIALALTSALLDSLGSIAPSGKLREGFRFAGYFTLLLAALGAVPRLFLD